MKAELHVPVSVQQALEKIDSALTEDKFVFSEEDATFVVKYTDKVIKTKKTSRFWSRKQLDGKYPATYALKIEGTIEEEEGGAVINLEIIEYHHGREHDYGGTRAINEYFDKFCAIFE